MKRLAVMAVVAGLLAFAGPGSADPYPGDGDHDFHSGDTPQHAVTADFNGDGRLDIAVANAFNDTVSVHMQENDGDFQPGQIVPVGLNVGPPPRNFPRYLVVQDINRDRKPDLIVVCSGGGNGGFTQPPSVQSLINRGDGQMLRQTADPVSSAPAMDPGFPVQMVSGRFTNDSFDDLALADLEGHRIAFMAGNGTGRFVPANNILLNSGGEPQDLAAFDLNRDGLTDLLVVTSSSFRVIRQSSPGVFAPPVSFALAQPAMELRAVALDDFDGDGRVDAVLADRDNRVHTLYGIDVNGSRLLATVRTHSSLGGCSDIASIQWDGDILPDVAVSNRFRDSVVILRSQGPVETLASSGSPRRLETGDIDNDGRDDLIIAHEGDQGNSSNQDITINFNPNELVTGSYQATMESMDDITNRFDVNLPGAHGISAPREDRVFVLAGSRRFLAETDMSASDRDEWTANMEIGGVEMQDDDNGFLVERFSPRIRAFETEGSSLEISRTINFSFDPGPLGFCGIAFDREHNEFYVSAPAKQRVLRLNENGNFLGELNVTPGAWDLAWDSVRDRLLAVNPGRSDMRAYTAAGVADGTRSKEWGSVSALFRETGFSGVAYEAEEDELYLLTSGGMLLRSSSSFVVSETTSIAPLGDVKTITYGPTLDEFYFLSEDGHIGALEMSGGFSDDLISLWPVLSSQPSFLPGGVSYDPLMDRLLVSDARSPRVALLRRNGQFEGMEDYSTQTGGPGGNYRGVEVDDKTGSRFLLGDYEIYDTTSSLRLPAPASAAGDLAIKAGLIVTPLLNSAEVSVINLNEPGVRHGLKLEPGARRGGLSVDAEGHIVRLNNTMLERYTLGGSSAAGDAWARYE